MKKSLVQIVHLCVYNIYANFCEDWTILVITIWERPNVFIQNGRFSMHYVNQLDAKMVIYNMNAFVVVC